MLLHASLENHSIGGIQLLKEVNMDEAGRHLISLVEEFRNVANAKVKIKINKTFSQSLIIFMLR